MELEELTAHIKVVVLQYVTDKEYGGYAQVSIASWGFSTAFFFKIEEPNKPEAFIFNLKGIGKGVILSFTGFTGFLAQRESHSVFQNTIFSFLFPSMLDGVNEAQRVYGGKASKGPIDEEVYETISFLGTEPVPSISFTRRLVWENKDRSDFEILCETLLEYS